MDESGGSESELVGSGNSSSQAKDDINFLLLFAEGDRPAALRERTKLEKERTEQARERTKQMHLQV